LHGDLIATTGPTGTVTGSGFYYDPFGQPLGRSGGAPSNTAVPLTRTTGLTDAWEGTHQVGYERLGGLDAILMGARLYLPTYGQFTSTDPIPGGNANPYMYPADPINHEDVTGLKGVGRGGGNRRRHTKYQNVPTHELLARYRDPNTSKAEKQDLKQELKARGVINSNADPTGRGTSNFSVHAPSTKVVLIGGAVVVIGVLGIVSGGSGFALLGFL
jgi:RHS repeat-associated protein